MSDHIVMELDRGVLTIRINRVDKKNALTTEMYRKMANEIERAGTDRSIRVILFTGTDGVFYKRWTPGGGMARSTGRSVEYSSCRVRQLIRAMDCIGRITCSRWHQRYR